MITQETNGAMLMGRGAYGKSRRMLEACGAPLTARQIRLAYPSQSHRHRKSDNTVYAAYIQQEQNYLCHATYLKASPTASELSSAIDRSSLQAAARATHRIAIHRRVPPSPTLQRYVSSTLAFPFAVYGLILLSASLLALSVRLVCPTRHTISLRAGLTHHFDHLITNTTHHPPYISLDFLQKVLRRWV